MENRDIVSYLEFSGNIEASEASTVYAAVAAQVTELNVEEGDYVKEGDVIAVLDSGEEGYAHGGYSSVGVVVLRRQTLWEVFFEFPD